MARASSIEYISAGVTSPTTTATVFISRIGTLVRLELIGFLYTVTSSFWAERVLTHGIPAARMNARALPAIGRYCMIIVSNPMKEFIKNWGSTDKDSRDGFIVCIDDID